MKLHFFGWVAGSTSEIIAPENEKLSIVELVDAFISEHAAKQGDNFVKRDGVTLTREMLIKAYKSARGDGLESAIRQLYRKKKNEA